MYKFYLQLMRQIIKGFLTVFNYLFYRKPIKLLKYSEVVDKLKLLKPGDVILVRTQGSVSNRIIPGFWKHVAVFIGENKIVEAVLPEVRVADIRDLLLHTSNVAFLRINNVEQKDVDNIVQIVKSYENKEYDQYLDTGDDTRVYCSEVVFDSINKVLGKDTIPIKYTLFYPTFSPDDCYASERFDVIYEDSDNG